LVTVGSGGVVGAAGSVVKFWTLVLDEEEELDVGLEQPPSARTARTAATSSPDRIRRIVYLWLGLLGPPTTVGVP